MFGVLASSSGCSASSKGHSSNSNNHHHHHQYQRSDSNHSKASQEKDRESFLTDELFNIVSCKRNAELVQKQHKQARRTYSHPHLFQLHKKIQKEKGKYSDDEEQGKQQTSGSGMNSFVLASLTCIGSDPFNGKKNINEKKVSSSDHGA